MKMQVLVRLKDGVLDVQGKAVQRTLGELGFDKFDGIRIGRLVEIEVSDSDPEKARKQVEEACQKLLANPVIEDFEIREAV